MSSGMVSTVDRTKVAVPAAPPQTLARDRVSRALAERGDADVLLIVAPAGSGKTTALINWVRSSDSAVAWLSVDAPDNEPRRFLRHLAHALGNAVPGSVDSVLGRIDAGADLAEVCLPALLEALADVARDRLILVLDDYHAIAARECHALVEALIAHRPASVQLVIASRTLPPAVLGQGGHTVVDASLLAFDLVETEQLLNRSFGLGLDRADLEAVHHALGGWPVGLALLAVGPQPRVGEAGSEIAARMATLAGAELADYLMEEVLEDLPGRDRDFLLGTSVLGRLTEPLCRAVLDDPAAGRLLGAGHPARRFLVEDGDGGFRVHDLIRDSLATLLARRAPERVALLHRRASDWFAGAQMPWLALEHAIAAGDGPRSGRLVRQHGPHWIDGGEWDRLADALDRTPDPGPELAPVIEAFALCTRYARGADQRLLHRRAWELIEAHPDDLAMQQVLIPIVANQFSGDVGRGIAAARAAFGRLPELDRELPLIRPCIGSSLWCAGELDEALVVLTPLLEPTPANLVSSNFSFIRGTASRIWADRGDPERAERYAREAVAPIIRNGTEAASAWGSIWVCLAEALRGTGQLEEARRHMDFGLERELTRPGSVGLGRALISDAELALAERRREQARKSARRARDILEAYPDPGTQLFHRLAAVDRQLAAKASDPLPHSALSEAELRILKELANGHTRARIAHDLQLSEETVKSHLRRIFRRLEVHSSEEAIRAAQARGLI